MKNYMGNLFVGFFKKKPKKEVKEIKLPQKENLEEFSQKISEKRLWNMGNFFIALIIGILIIIFFFILITFWELTRTNATILASFFMVIYAIILFFLLEPAILREIEKIKIKTIEKPVIKQIQQSQEPFIKQVMHETEKRIYVTNAPEIKYNYLGSNLTKTYHKNSCRLGKLIKKENKIENNDENYFKKRGYKPCKICILNLTPQKIKKLKQKTKNRNQEINSIPLIKPKQIKKIKLSTKLKSTKEINQIVEKIIKTRSNKKI